MGYFRRFASPPSCSAPRMTLEGYYHLTSKRLPNVYDVIALTFQVRRDEITAEIAALS